MMKRTTATLDARRASTHPRRMGSVAPRLVDIPDEDLPLSSDPTLDWFHAHFEEVQKYKGQRIAIDPARGIIAAGTLREVYAQLEAAGISPDSDVVIHTVL